MMTKEYYWPHMSHEGYPTVGDCCKCVWNKPPEKVRCPLELFLSSDPLELHAMDTLGPLLKMSNVNQFMVVMMGRYSKFARAVQTFNTTATHIDSIHMDHGINPYGIPVYMMTNS